jgi:hypothetical protein
MGTNRYILIAIVSALGVAYVTGLRAEDKDPFVSIIDLQQQENAGEEKIKLDLSNVVVKGIIWSNAKVMAIINQDMVMVGDTWGEFQVESIDQKSVTLLYKGKTYKLFVEESSWMDKKLPAPKIDESPPPEGKLSYPPEGPLPGASNNEFSPENNMSLNNPNEAPDTQREVAR